MAEHGTRSCYTAGCRCDGCRVANREYVTARRRAAGVPARADTVATFQAVLRPAGRAYVFSYLARERAAANDELSSGRLMEHARAAAALVPLDDPGWGWWSVHGELGGWDSTRPVTLPIRRIGLHEEVMNACVALGDVERACVSGITALDVSKVHGLVLRPKVILAARRLFPPATDTLPLVRELDERLRLAA